MDRKPNGAVFTGAQLLATDEAFGLINLDPQYVGRFQILYDRTFTCAPGGKQIYKFKFTVPLKGIKASYNNVGATINELQKNHLAMGFWAYNNGQNCSLDANVRTRFSDA